MSYTDPYQRPYSTYDDYVSPFQGRMSIPDYANYYSTAFEDALKVRQATPVFNDLTYSASAGEGQRRATINLPGARMTRPAAPAAPQTLPMVPVTPPKLEMPGRPWEQKLGLYGGAAMAGLGLLGAWKGSRNPYRSSIDREKARYKEFTDPNSRYYGNARGMMSRLFADASPTVNTLTAAGRTGGLSAMSASNIAYQQARAQSLRNQEAVGQGVRNLYLQSQGLADASLARLGQYEMAAEDTQRSFGEQLFGMGTGLLGLIL